MGLIFKTLFIGALCQCLLHVCFVKLWAKLKSCQTLFSVTVLCLAFGSDMMAQLTEAFALRNVRQIETGRSLRFAEYVSSGCSGFWKETEM